MLKGDESEELPMDLPPLQMFETAHFAAARDELVASLKRLGITDALVLGAISNVPRERFLSPSLGPSAYLNTALSLSHGQTISQPSIVALMTQAADLTPTARVLEIGTGSGYQAAILAEICQDVYSVEIIPELAAGAALRLKQLGYKNVHTKGGDGHEGWKEAAPFDAILVTAGADQIPQALMTQLVVGGRLIIPLASDRGDFEVLTRITKTSPTNDFVTEALGDVRFVPFVSPSSPKDS